MTRRTDITVDVTFSCGHVAGVHPFSGRDDFSPEAIASFKDWYGRSRLCPTCTAAKEAEDSAFREEMVRDRDELARQLASAFRKNGYPNARAKDCRITGVSGTLYIHPNERWVARKRVWEYDCEDIIITLNDVRVKDVRAAVRRADKESQRIHLQIEADRKEQHRKYLLMEEATKALGAGLPALLNKEQCELILNALQAAENCDDY